MIIGTNIRILYYLIRNNRIHSVLVSAKAAVIVIPANKMQFQNYYSYVFLSSSVDGKVDWKGSWKDDIFDDKISITIRLSASNFIVIQISTAWFILVIPKIHPDPNRYKDILHLVSAYCWLKAGRANTTSCASWSDL